MASKRRSKNSRGQNPEGLIIPLQCDLIFRTAICDFRVGQTSASSFTLKPPFKSRHYKSSDKKFLGHFVIGNTICSTELSAEIVAKEENSLHFDVIAGGYRSRLY